MCCEVIKRQQQPFSYHVLVLLKNSCSSIMRSGGHNFWMKGYLLDNPILDLKLTLQGQAVSRDGNIFADQLWRMAQELDREKNSLLSLF